jgi:hypothetical protein
MAALLDWTPVSNPATTAERPPTRQQNFPAQQAHLDTLETLLLWLS